MEEFGSICREMLLWPEGAPVSSGLSGAELTLGPGLVGNVSVPVLYVYPSLQPCGQAVILCPGGGFRGVAIEHEGRAFVRWFNERGITLAVLKYRLPNGRREIPGEDIRRAVYLLKEHSGELRIRSLGVMGASIGGYVAALAALFPEAGMRPDFQILLYPVISMRDGLTHLPSRERLMGPRPSGDEIASCSLDRHVSAETPPAFIALAEDDQAVTPENSLLYYRALMKNRVPASLHIYPEGGHSFGFSDTFRYKREWLAELEKWLGELR